MDTLSFKVSVFLIASILLVLFIPTVIWNFLVFRVITKNRELHQPPYLVIANLAISDCLTGCTTFLCYTTVCIKLGLGKDPCSVAIYGTLIGYLLGFVTYLTIAFQTTERFFAIFFPFVYRTNFTIRTVAFANSLIWLTSLSAVIYYGVTKNDKIFFGILGVTSFICMNINIYCYARIFLKTRNIEKQIRKQTMSVGDKRKLRSESKVARVTAMILSTVLACYAPLLILELYVVFGGKKTLAISYLLYWGWLLALANSSINPVITCSQLSVLRRAIFGQRRVFYLQDRKITPSVSSALPKPSLSTVAF